MHWPEAVSYTHLDVYKRQIQAYQEAIHSQSYGYILDTICSPEERSEILYQWKDDPFLLARNKFIGDKYNDFYYERTKLNLAKTLIANYILEGIYFYSGFMFFYALGRNGKMPGTVPVSYTHLDVYKRQEISH